MRLEQDDIQTGLGQMQGRRQPGIACADDADIRLELTAQRIERRKRRGGGSIPAGRILPLTVIGEEQVHGEGARMADQTFISRCSRSHGLMTCRNSSYSARLMIE